MKEIGTLHTLLGVETGATTLEGNVVVSIKILNTHDLVLSFNRFHPREELVELQKETNKNVPTHCNMEKLGNKGKNTLCPKSDKYCISIIWNTMQQL